MGIYVILERTKTEPKFGFLSIAQKELLNYEVTPKVWKMPKKKKRNFTKSDKQELIAISKFHML